MVHATWLDSWSPAPVIVHLLPVGASGVAGTATLAFAGDDHLRVAMAVAGLLPGSAAAGQIRFGTCASEGPVAFPLPSLTAGPDGSATAATTLPGIQVIPPEGWSIEVLQGATALACGAVAPAAPVLSPGASVRHGPVAVTLAMQDGSPANGMAVLAFCGSDTLIATVRLSALEPCTVHPAHIHFGSCAAGGPIGYPLRSLVAGPDGTAVSTTVIPQIQVIPPIGWYVNVHQGPTLAGAGATPIACGDVVTGGPVLP